MYRRVVPGLPVMMVLGNALGDAARKQAEAKRSKAQPEVVGALQPQAKAPASRAA